MNRFKEYVGKGVLVMGGAGFMGSALTKRLSFQKADVTAIDDFSHGKRDMKIKPDPERLRCFDLDTLICDNRKARKILGWSPEMGLKEGLKKTIDWFIKNGERWPWEK